MTKANEAACSPDLSELLAPLRETDPVGESLRYGPVYSHILDARFEDDHSLPMGEWTRPLKKADWRAVESLCIDALRKSSKDLQVAAWLTEAWIRRCGLAGLVAGSRLLEGLCRDFWEDIHPRIEDGDAEIRTAPLFWANDTFAEALLLHVPLMPCADAVTSYLTLNDWQRAVAAEFSPGTSRDGKIDGAPYRQDILQEALEHIPFLITTDEDAQKAIEAWRALVRLLDDKLGNESPSLSKVIENLRQIRLAVRSLLQQNDPREAIAAQVPNLFDHTAMDTGAMMPVIEGDTMNPLPIHTPDALTEVSLVASRRVASRVEAYRLLEIAAAFLEQTEPHSPTPYLIKRAITWGRLPLPELMQEVIREEGDISRYFSLLGVKPK